MTPVATCCGPDDDLRDVEQKMTELQVRRIPIVDGGGRCVGIVSQADIALAASRDTVVTDREIALVVGQISQPSGADRSPIDTGTGFNEAGTAQQF
jgi:predicted transcriptional regulator